MRCGRIPIGRHSDAESDDEDTDGDGDEELGAAIPHGSDA